MGLAAELSCPQCGAPVGLDEADHLVTCPFCKVTSFLAASSYHFVLPPRSERGDELLFAPYLRFKGVVYGVGETEILHRIADVTFRSLAMPALPLSLGVRPQAMRLRFAAPEMGVFLKGRATLAEAIDSVTRVLTLEAGVVHHLCSIGETVSRIYLPIALRGGQAYDGVSGDLLGRMPADRDLFASVRDPGYAWQPHALAALCPACGWNLEGAPASVVLLCRQCDTAWQAGREGYARVEVTTLAGPGREGKEGGLALPFWRIEVEGKSDDGPLRCRADFGRVTGQPYPPRPGWEERPLAIWSPAFKVRPKIYLQAARQLTTLQPETDDGAATVLPRQTHPITMPLSEAAEALRICLATTAYRKREFMALLPGLDLQVTAASLVFIPFRATVHDLVQEELGVSINRKALEFGSAL